MKFNTEKRNNMRGLVIIPAYNEEKSIEKTVRDIEKNAPDFDYVIVNDGSTDETLNIAKKNRFNIISLPVNLGIGGAVQTGYRYAKKYGYDYAVQVDGDGQHDPAFLEEMLYYCVKNKVNMVIGSRYLRKEGFQSSKIRRVGISYFSGLISFFTKQKITDPTSGLRMGDRKIIELFSEEYPKDYPKPETIVSAINHKLVVKEIPVVMRERMEGESSITPRKSIYYMVKVSIAIFIEAMRKGK